MVSLHNAGSGEKRRSSCIEKRGDHTGRRSEHKAIELGSIPACIPPKQETLLLPTDACRKVMVLDEGEGGKAFRKKEVVVPAE